MDTPYNQNCMKMESICSRCAHRTVCKYTDGVLPFLSIISDPKFHIAGFTRGDGAAVDIPDPMNVTIEVTCPLRSESNPSEGEKSAS